MELTAQTINILLLLLPGLLGLRFYSFLSGKSPDSLWGYAIDSVIFMLFIYMPLEYIGVWAPIVQLNGQSLDIMIAQPHQIVWCLVSALLMAALIALMIRVGVLSFVFRFLRLTDLTSHDTAWHDVMSKKKYIRVHRKGGELLFGWPRYYSLDQDHGFIYLEKVYSFDDEEDDWVEIENADGVLLNVSDISTIEVVK